MTNRMFAPALALAALATAQTAQAQQPTCVSAADLGDAVVYAMPIAFDAAQTACANRWSRDGFAAREGEAFITNFRAGQDEAWPGAFRVLKTFMAGAQNTSEDANITAMIAALPDSALRPFVDGLVGQMIAGEIKGDSCTKIEQGLELISPMPADNVGGLFALLAEIADLKDPQICGAAPPAKTK